MKEITTTTIYTEEKIKAFLRHYYFYRLRTTRIAFNILILIIIINFFTKNGRTVFDIIAFICALIGILELNTSFLPWFNFRKLKRRKDSIIGSKLTYTLKKNNFKLTTDKDEYIDYNTLKTVVETNEDYYLYINSTRSLILDKNNLSSEEVEYLTNLFKEKVSTYVYKKNV